MGLFRKKIETPTQAVLLLGGGVVDVVGESHYQDAFERVCGGRGRDGHNLDLVVLLVAEPNNPYDPNAVGVYLNEPGDITQNKLGHLSRDAAIAFQPVARHLAGKGVVPAVNATIRGGWDRGRGDQGSFGITLDLAPPDLCVPEDMR